jgi:hypothetical protein
MLYRATVIGNRERSGILRFDFLCAASGSVRARPPPAAPGRGRPRGVHGCASLSGAIVSVFGTLGVPPRATKVPYRSLAVIVAGLLAILCGYEVAAESFMTD